MTDVRLCTPDDLPELSRREVNPGSGFARRALDLASRGDYFLVGAFSGNEIMGYVVLDCRPETDLRPEMKSLWVYPEHRRRGLGMELTRFIEGMAAAQGFTEINMGVDPENPAAIPMYIGLDYTPTGDHRVVVDEVSGREQSEAIYRKSLLINH